MPLAATMQVLSFKVPLEKCKKVEVYFWSGANTDLLHALCKPAALKGRREPIITFMLANLVEAVSIPTGKVASRGFIGNNGFHFRSVPNRFP